MNRHAIARPRGHLLVTCLVLVLGLSLTATTALQLAALELRIAEVFIRRLEAGHDSELARRLFADILERQLIDRDSSPSLPPGFERLDPAPWHEVSAECGGSSACPLPAYAEMLPKARYRQGAVDAELYLFRLRVAAASGQHLGMARGYSGSGQGMAGGGGRLYFHVESRATASRGDPPPRTASAATYRHVIQP